MSEIAGGLIFKEALPAEFDTEYKKPDVLDWLALARDTVQICDPRKGSDDWTKEYRTADVRQLLMDHDWPFKFKFIEMDNGGLNIQKV
jgi:hypothetical protein